jgi:SIR2-like domain
VVVYLALGRHRGKFLHLKADGGASVVEVPNAYTELSLDRTTVLFKIHGGVDPRPGREWESFVVSEDDYIDYLAQADISVVLPVTLAARLRRSHFLFLGYPVEEWSLRVFLHRLFGREKSGYRSWAIGPEPGEIEQELWRQRGVDVVDVPLDEYLAALRARVEAEAGR